MSSYSEKEIKKIARKTWTLLFEEGLRNNPDDVTIDLEDLESVVEWIFNIVELDESL